MKRVNSDPHTAEIDWKKLFPEANFQYLVQSWYEEREDYYTANDGGREVSSFSGWIVFAKSFALLEGRMLPGYAILDAAPSRDWAVKFINGNLSALPLFDDFVNLLAAGIVDTGTQSNGYAPGVYTQTPQDDWEFCEKPGAAFEIVFLDSFERDGHRFAGGNRIVFENFDAVLKVIGTARDFSPVWYAYRDAFIKAVNAFRKEQERQVKLEAARQRATEEFGDEAAELSEHDLLSLFG